MKVTNGISISLHDKVAFVTGSGGGIGRASAKLFSAAGARVVVADIDEAGGKDTVAQIAADGGEAVFVQCDVASESSVSHAIDHVRRVYGHLDVAHNNAGVTPRSGDTVACTREVWDRTLGVNLTGTWLCMKYEIAAMLETGGGAIVNTSSVAALVAFPDSPAYAASKWGVIGATRAAAREQAANGIRVNVICPGAAVTGMLEGAVAAGKTTFAKLASGSPMNRLGDPAEVAAAAVWLCSDAASFVTGSVLPVEGGMALGS